MKAFDPPDADSSESVPVIGSSDSGEERPIFAPCFLAVVLYGDLQCRLHSSGSTVGVEDLSQSGRDSLHEHPRQLNRGRRREPQERRVTDPPELIADRGID